MRAASSTVAVKKVTALEALAASCDPDPQNVGIATTGICTVEGIVDPGGKINRPPYSSPES